MLNILGALADYNEDLILKNHFPLSRRNSMHAFLHVKNEETENFSLLKRESSLSTIHGNSDSLLENKDADVKREISETSEITEKENKRVKVKAEILEESTSLKEECTCLP